MLIRKIIILLLIVTANAVFAQKFADKQYYLVDSLILNDLSKADSILIDSSLFIFHQTNNDTTKAYALNNICQQMAHENWTKFQLYLNNFLEASLKKELSSKEKKALAIYYAKSLNNTGIIHDNLGEIEKAEHYYSLALNNWRKLDNKKGISGCLNNLGYLYKNQGQIQKALKYYNESLKIDESINNHKGIAESLNNIASIYKTQNEYESALNYYKKSLIHRRIIKDDIGAGLALNNIGTVYREFNNYELALLYLDSSLTIFKSKNFNKGILGVHNNIAGIYKQQGKHDQSLSHYLSSIKLAQELKHKLYIARCANNVGNLYLKLNNMDSARYFGELCLKIGQEMNSPNILQFGAKLLSEVYKHQNNFNNALSMYELHIQMRDSIKNEENQKAAIRQQTQYEFEKAQLVAEQRRNEELRIQNEKLERRNNLQYSAIFIAIIGVFGLVMTLGKIQVSSKIAEGLIFFAFLILFEFLLVLSDPYVDSITNGEPVYKLMVNAILAGCIFPAHAYFEGKFKKRLVNAK